MLTSGTSEAYTHIFRLLCEPGDEVLVPAPSYPLFEYLADLAMFVVPYQLVSYGSHNRVGRWISAVARRAVTAFPGDAGGASQQSYRLVRQGLRRPPKLRRFAADREMAMVADEVFLDYAAGRAPPATFAFHDGVLTFTLSGLSKVSRCRR